MELTLRSEGGGRVEVSDAAFGAPYRESLVHQVVTAYLAGARRGTKATKSRSDVRGGGSKPWRQKGTGRARAGTIRSPLWRGGGMTFAARPRDYSQKVNRKMYRGAMRSLFSELIRQGRLVVVETFELGEARTKLAAEKLAALDCHDVLIVTEGFDERLALAVRNLPWAAAVEASQVSPVSLLAFEKVLITAAALKRFEERLA